MRTGTNGRNGSEKRHNRSSHGKHDMHGARVVSYHEPGLSIFTSGDFFFKARMPGVPQRLFPIPLELIMRTFSIFNAVVFI